MRDETVARSYAETLFALAERHEGADTFAEGIEVVARLIDENPGFRQFLETPRVAAGEKKKVLRKVLGPFLPPHLVNFVLVTLDKRRQRLLRDISREYHVILNEHRGLLPVEVTVARPLDDADVAALSERLSALLGKTAIPQVRVKPQVLGGILVRAEDTIYDGTLLRRLEGMRRKLLAAPLADRTGASRTGDGERSPS